MKTKRNLLVTLADSKHTDAARQLFSSAYFNGGWNEDMMLLAHEESSNRFTEEQLEWFRKKNIFIKKCKPIDNEVSKYASKNMTPIVFDKFYLFQNYIKRWKKIVFLDADIIVNGSIKSLVSIDNMGTVPAPIKSSLYHQFLRPGSTKNIKRLFKKNHSKLFERLTNEYDLRKDAFNAGVFAFDSNIITDKSFYELSTILRKYKNIIRNPAEAVLSIYFSGMWKKLPLAYNFMGSNIFSFTEKDINRGIILHFLGKNKPWNPDNPLHWYWKKNLEMADKIGEKRDTAKEWSNFRVKMYSLYNYYCRKKMYFKIKGIEWKKQR